MEEEKIKENVKGEEVSKSYDFSNSPDSTKKYILFEKTKTLYTIIYPKLNLFPKSERFTLRQRIEELILDSIKLLIKQNYKTNNDEINNVKDKEEEKKEIQKIYKPLNFNSNNMLPGDPKGSPDGYFSKTLVFIDAGFLSKLSKYFGNGQYLFYDIIQFADNISNKQGLICKKVFYYTAPPFQSENPSDEEKKRKDKYDTFFRKLSNNSRFKLREGRCQRLKLNDKFKFCQKGIDTLMTMDLVSVPLKFPEIKKIILIVCDSDFVPVIKQLKEFGLEVILYTYFTKRRNTNFSRSSHLINVVPKYVRLIKEDFIKSPLKKKEKITKINYTSPKGRGISDKQKMLMISIRLERSNLMLYSFHSCIYNFKKFYGSEMSFWKILFHEGKINPLDIQELNINKKQQSIAVLESTGILAVDVMKRK